jgi:hypothetical protein
VSNFSSFFTTAAEILGLFIVAIITVKAYKQLFHARVSIDFLPPSTETYVQTPDAVGNQTMATSGIRQLSHSKFRVKIHVSTSKKIQVHGAALYAYHRDMARQWAELSPITLPVLSNEGAVHHSIAEFVEANSRPAVAGSVILDNGTEKHKIELSAGEGREMVIARLGGFILPLPERNRTISGTNYCDVLLRLNINSVAAAFLVCLPRYDAHDESGPIVSDFKIFRRAKTVDVLTWATKVRPQPGAEGGRRAEKFWVKLHK